MSEVNVIPKRENDKVIATIIIRNGDNEILSQVQPGEIRAAVLEKEN